MSTFFRLVLDSFRRFSIFRIFGNRLLVFSTCFRRFRISWRQLCTTFFDRFSHRKGTQRKGFRSQSGSLGGLLETSWGPLGGSRGLPEPSWDPLGGLLGRSWGHLLGRSNFDRFLDRFWSRKGSQKGGGVGAKMGPKSTPKRFKIEGDF